jgi:hypothetical protein
MHGLKMNEAEGMIQEMGGRESEQDQPGADANALKDVSTKQGVHDWAAVCAADVARIVRRSRST